MAQARKIKLSATAQKQMDIVNNVKGKLTLEPIIIRNRVPNLASNFLTAWEVRGLLEERRPGSSYPEAQKVYDAAVKQLGNGDAEAARKKLDKHMAKAIRQLNSKVESQRDLGDVAPSIEAVLRAIRAKADDPDHLAKFMEYRGIALDVSGLLSKSQLDVPASELPIMITKIEKPKTSVGASKPIRSLVSPFFSVDRFFYVAKEKDLEIYVGEVHVTDEQELLFSSPDATKRYVGALAWARAARMNNEPQSSGCGALIDALGGVTHQQILSSDAYTRVMDLLRANKRDEALQLLEHDFGTLFNAMFQAANNLFVATMDDKFIRFFTAEATLVFPIYGDIAKYQQWLEGKGKKPETVYQLFAGITADALGGKALLRGIQEGVTTGGSLEKVGAGGFALGASAGLIISTAVRKAPMKITVHVNMGYWNVKANEEITTTSQTGHEQKERVQESGYYLGVYGVEFQFPEKAGYSKKYKLWLPERAGIGAVGDPRNAFAYYTISTTYKRKGSSRFQGLVTPIYSGFWNKISGYHATPGAEVEPIRWMKELGQSIHELGFAVNWKIDSKTGVQTFDYEGRYMYSPHPSMEFKAHLGYLHQAFGDKEEQIPGFVGPGFIVGGIGFKYTIGAKGRPKETEATAGGIKSPRLREAPLQRRLRLAGEMLWDPQKAKGPKGQQTAKDLAGALQGEFLTNPQVREDTHYKAAIKHLEAGRLREGLKELAKAPGFR
jgi:hypothetical protein